MVHITEMRVVLPLTVEEFKRAQRFANFKTNELNTVEGQGGQLLSSSPYEHEVWGEGVYTHSLYRLGDRIPDWVTKLVPSNALVIDEKTWMAFPYIRTTISIPFFNKLKIEMLSMHADDDGSTENILNLSEAELAIRKVDMVDIAFDDVPKRDYKLELDPKLYSSKKTGRGPLGKDWRDNVVSKMCAYKLVKVEANYWGVQNRAEKLMINGIRQIVLLTHRNAFCWIDEWFDLSLEEICAREALGRQRLKATVKQPPVIDPRTGQEVVLDAEEPSSQDTDSSDETSDIEAEYFEAEMEWGNQDGEQFGTNHSSERLMNNEMAEAGDRSLVIQPSDVPERCAVCATRDSACSPPALFCTTCREFFCQKCFSEFHVTARLKAHDTQQLLNSFVSLDLRRTIQLDKEGPKKATGLPPVHRAIHKSMSDASHLNHSFKNGYETKLSNKQDERFSSMGSPARGSGSPLIENRGISRTSSKLRSTKSGFGALNAFQSSDDILIQNTVQAGFPSSKLITSESDLDALQDHPNELSEELVRTVASIHQRIAESVSSSSLTRTSSQDLGVSKRKFRRRPSQDLSTTEVAMEHEAEPAALDPYGMKEDYAAWDVGVYANSLEVTVLPTESNLKEFIPLYQRLQGLLEVLKHVEPKEMSHEQRTPFWINIYNTLMLHASLIYGVPRSNYKRVNLMNKVTYIVGRHQYSPLIIEHSILRSNSYRPALASLLPIPRHKKNDETTESSLEQAEPLVSFALCSGSWSSPVLRVYTVANVQAELDLACRDYLMAAVGVNKRKRILLPKILHWYARDFSHDAESLIEWIASKLPAEKRAVFDECLKKGRGKSTRHRISVQSYDWSFRYLYDPKLL